MSRAGGKLGNTNVTIMTRKKPAAHAAPNVLFDICKECVRDPFFTLYEFSILIQKFALGWHAAILVGLVVGVMNGYSEVTKSPNYWSARHCSCNRDK